jgi:hypothetical protein
VAGIGVRLELIAWEAEVLTSDGKRMGNSILAGEGHRTRARRAQTCSRYTGSK